MCVLYACVKGAVHNDYKVKKIEPRVGSRQEEKQES